MLTAAWIPRHKRKDHAERRRFLDSPARIKWVCGARRSGKSTDGLDCSLVGHGPVDADGMPLFRGALNPPAGIIDPTFVIALPTREMVKRLWWNRTKARLPQDLIEAKDESDLWIRLRNGSTIHLLGMDRPTRAEGFAIDGLVGDEFAYWKQGAYERSLRPALSTPGRPPGWAILMGKPSGRNHFFDSWSKAKAGRKGHDAFHWPSSVIIDPAELEQARMDLDDRSYMQEYEASFLTASGLVYYGFQHNKHVRPVFVDPAKPLAFSFDFNVSPGSAVAIQELELPPWDNPKGQPHVHTVVVGEAHIPDDSRSDLVCRQLGERFAGHRGPVHFYGDPSGGKRDTRGESNDWDVIQVHLRKHFPGCEVRSRVAREAPRQVDSANSVNARLENAAGMVRFAINADRAPQTLLDLEGVAWDEDKEERQIDKSDDKRTHWSDALRYYVHERHPLGGGKVTTS